MSPKPVRLTTPEWVALLGEKVPDLWPAELTGVQPDSRRIRSGDLFIAIEGFEGDGHRFVTDAIRKGAAGIVAAHALPVRVSVPVVLVDDPRAVLTRLSRHLYGYADEKLRLTGVTGTNGKTSVVGYIYQLLEQCGHKCGQLGTVSYRFGEREIPARRTTPGAPELHEYLKSMADAGCGDCVMEVSSHALDQRRVDKLSFDAAVFTNLSQDHLDYHQDMESYFQAKVTLFRNSSLQHRIAGDDEWSRRLSEACGHPVLRCGFSDDCEVNATMLHSDLNGIKAEVRTPWGRGVFQLPQPGEHNLRNVLQALAVTAGYGLPFDELLTAVSRLKAAPGRLERVPSGCGTVLVDYAHTPDALENILSLLKPLTGGKLIVVFGCGGDRDRSKRPLMVRACALADEMILTHDNPRTEDPAQIFSDMKTGLEAGDSYQVIEDRRKAIETGVNLLRGGDVLLIAGKGHETVQSIGAMQLPFDDRVVAGEFIAKREHSKTGKC
ncbi:UDP-N-acetylmuramoyl-L-alanyl-D-glutamate--2,6-diaminopimelate ligase [Kiritimatiellaeota bacterium B1221]|nr:UDP-N-acetylmuramoyl-L-alanyl-D-glutamate--2,6-diaminopimelate ligase [Kiritimatiellaeota bacterium B1221]